MKIVFICSNLEPGYDGVGDYTRRLAGQLVRLGHHVSMVAWMDTHINESRNGLQTDEIGTVIQVLRIPAGVSKRVRSKQVNEWIALQKPDWVSLQYVPFAYQRKGLPVGLASQLSRLNHKGSWEVMFHELWVGMEKNVSWKFRLWGMAQRMLIKNLLIKLAPRVIHTQTRLYQWQLSRLGYQSEYLPLFTNVPIVPGKKKATRKGLELIVFGGIHAGTAILDFAQELAQYASQHSQTAQVTFIGNNGQEIDNWIKACVQNGIPTRNLGFQPPQVISQMLQQATHGITSTPYLLLEKSGTVMAMRAHGLPIICLANPWQVQGYKEHPSATDLRIYEKGNLSFCLNEPRGPITPNELDSVAPYFIHTLYG
ncbi:hypothetical protein [Siphonobacter sp. SORGH_AS_1065]|uniref:hypothetical protein n=1 Tax=Siphonobacter sp. SORGH_AS_1065 TaxID=3041795 RepID=UPI00278A3E1A|nr:hypothetical protein [Siphonobacter sp. SORGH_AS_1065]MDQ1085603.1 hypothetical protein [Siphonobacter sp. SORGH_AS_1065]